MKLRGIILAKKKPRRMELQPNVFTDGKYKDYDITNEGVIESYMARYAGGSFQEDVYQLWDKYADRVRMVPCKK